jgi:hypothetical protein
MLSNIALQTKSYKQTSTLHHDNAQEAHMIIIRSVLVHLVDRETCIL